ncbi:MAG: acetylxylan esterase [Rariglobus sp.]
MKLSSALRLSLLSATVLVASTVGAFARVTSVTTDHPNGVYASGAEAVFKLVPDAQGFGSAPLTVKILRDNRSAVQTLTVTPDKAGEPIRFKPPADGWYFLSVSAEGEKKPLATTGVVFNPESFKPSTPTPDEFGAFWAAQKARLAASPAETKLEPLTPSQRALETQNADHLKNILNWEKQGSTAVNLEITCLDVQPLRAYYAKPQEPVQKGHPAILFFRAAGVEGGWCRSSLVNAMSYANRFDALVVDLNAHGMLNGQPQSYYDALAKGELAGYQSQGKESRDTFYFLGMFLRLQRAIDFLTKQPEWDGKNVICIGISQGGAQALAAAGLDSRVNVVISTVPGMCDIAGRAFGNTGGWPHVGEGSDAQTKLQIETVRYFDMVSFAARSKAATLMTVGLVDTTCPPPGVYAAFNALKTEKRMTAVADKGHHALSTWNAEQRIEQDAFIRAQIDKTR